MRVSVPFGKSKLYTGIVFTIHNTAPLAYEAKAIHQILDDAPVVNALQLRLWQWIANYYLCTLGDIMRAALPNVLILESETVLTKTSIAIQDARLEDDEFLVYEALQHQSSLKIQDVMHILDKKTVLPVINRLIKKRVISVREEVLEKYKPKLVRYVKLSGKYTSDLNLHTLLENLSRATKQREVILTLFMLTSKTKKPVKVSELALESKASPAIIKALIDKGILEEYHIQTDRIVFSGNTNAATKQLSAHQFNALSQIEQWFQTHETVLLHGVTSSGKTEVYVKLIENTLQNGKQVLYLLPEIALTTQLVTRLQNYFGKKVAVFHSRYSSQERVEVWYNMLRNAEKAQIILGARSAVLLPYNNLGLIIVDEEHEQSFKQFDPAPRYHARDVAIVLAQMSGAKTLLGSATPSLESYFNARKQRYGLVSLTQRYNNVLMPEVELIDIKNKHKRKLMRGHFSDRLIEEITETLSAGQQIILFQNRRGFSPIVECNTCGHAPQCPNCDVSLTYHQYRNQLRCHYCSYNTPMLTTCNSCGSPELDNKGFGTEQIEEEVRLLFPECKVGRMDLDTTRGKYGYEKIITAFEQQEIDILVGTQMLTKGLDFRNVKLVAVMNADNMLNFPDFRAHERSFQLITQVSGRAGRTEARGKVLIQTYNPYHNILQQASTNNYFAMYEEQMNERYNYKYPPIYKQIKIVLKHKNYDRVEQGSIWFAKSLKQVFNDFVLGPESPSIGRIRNQYYKNILLKIPKQQSLSKTKEAIVKINNSFLNIKDFRSVKVILNVDNY